LPILGVAAAWLILYVLGQAEAQTEQEQEGHGDRQGPQR
jgi:hypothetical protein